MRKRSSFDLKPRDFYRTIDPSAMVPEFIKRVKGRTFAEPFCGDGALIDLLNREGLLHVLACDIAPQGRYDAACYRKDALTLQPKHLDYADTIITNPPYTWDVFDDSLSHLKSIFQRPIWLLLPADWMHNKRVAYHMKDCKTVVSIGRLYWEDNKVKGKDNYCWYEFINGWDHETVFIPRVS